MTDLFAGKLRYDWSLEEIEAIYTRPLPELIFRAQSVHRTYHQPDEVQGCTLLSIKTGGCPEDCAYCPQSAHYQTGLDRTGLLPVAEALEAAARANKVRRASVWVRPGAMCRTARSSSACSKWFAACARSDWKPAARWGC